MFAGLVLRASGLLCEVGRITTIHCDDGGGGDDDDDDDDDNDDDYYDNDDVHEVDE